MSNNHREETLKAWAASAGQRLGRAGDMLAARQILSGQDPGNVQIGRAHV